ncbi:MAG: nitroreductase family protein [Clostridia bacterium]
MNSIYTRRSVRSYKDTPVEQEKLMQMLKAGMQAPSAQNQQGWEFILVTNKAELTKISKMCPSSKMADGAGFAIVVLGNFDKMPNVAPKWQQDLGACTQNIMLEAVNLGLGTVWVGVHPTEERVSYLVDLYKLPSNIKPYAVVVGGYPLTDDANKFIDRFDESKIHFEKY